ncbi:hypothetical protein BLNAU_12543 [Blattamonas nauphoetae]|uniref:Uncharacterized protein n=1 Tax=Blattamonas nauphoetae TaxID=2049346 RepID=A0ABQ9XPB0_9EUKA|nr:hypothetical protein BLNAU_12543 [Blattamonas nauphoetae]
MSNVDPSQSSLFEPLSPRNGMDDERKAAFLLPSPPESFISMSPPKKPPYTGAVDDILHLLDQMNSDSTIPLTPKTSSSLDMTHVSSSSTYHPLTPQFSPMTVSILTSAFTDRPQANPDDVNVSASAVGHSDILPSQKSGKKNQEIRSGRQRETELASSERTDMMKRITSLETEKNALSASNLKLQATNNVLSSNLRVYEIENETLKERVRVFEEAEQELENQAKLHVDHTDPPSSGMEGVLEKVREMVATEKEREEKWKIVVSGLSELQKMSTKEGSEVMTGMKELEEVYRERYAEWEQERKDWDQREQQWRQTENELTEKIQNLSNELTETIHNHDLEVQKIMSAQNDKDQKQAALRNEEIEEIQRKHDEAMKEAKQNADHKFNEAQINRDTLVQQLENELKMEREQRKEASSKILELEQAKKDDSLHFTRLKTDFDRLTCDFQKRQEDWDKETSQLRNKLLKNRMLFESISMELGMLWDDDDSEEEAIPPTAGVQEESSPSKSPSKRRVNNTTLLSVLQAQLKAKEKITAERDDLQNKLEDTLSQLKAGQDSWTREKERLMESLSDLRGENKRVFSELDGMTETMETVEFGKREVEKQLRETKLALDEAEAMKNELGRRVLELVGEVGEHERKCGELTGQVSLLASERDLVKKENEVVRDNLRMLLRELEETRQEVMEVAMRHGRKEWEREAKPSRKTEREANVGRMTPKEKVGKTHLLEDNPNERKESDLNETQQSLGAGSDESLWSVSSDRTKASEQAEGEWGRGRPTESQRRLYALLSTRKSQT